MSKLFYFIFLIIGNWLWLSASCFFYQYYRVYSPISFGKKTDKTGQYIRKYVPELKNFPASTIYEPWTESLVDQKKYNCVLGEHYPHRIVIHEEVMKNNLEKMNLAYKKNREKKGNTSSENGYKLQASDASISTKKKKS